MDTSLRDAASHHLPAFITAPGQTDWLLVVMGLVLVGVVLGAGVFFFWLHSLPERMVHNKVQFDLVCVLALLSLFTHVHAFWVAALIIAFIELPSFSVPDFANAFQRIATSLEAMADTQAQSKASKLLPLLRSESATSKPSPSALAKSSDGISVTDAQREALRKRGAEHA